ncbi:MAG: hypothetical protein KKA19_09415 [Candidatus Margulisbacteria bacterium]|nr:hypothetical protein [Candidatus Margulisiibacteriota bacterium]
MLDDIKNVEFKVPEESEEEKNTRFQKMTSELLKMVIELKEEYEKNNDDKVKKQLKTAWESLEKLNDKLKRNIH